MEAYNVVLLVSPSKTELNDLFQKQRLSSKIAIILGQPEIIIFKKSI